MTARDYEEKLNACRGWFDPACGCRACLLGRWLLAELQSRDRDLADAENALWDAAKLLDDPDP